MSDSKEARSSNEGSIARTNDREISHDPVIGIYDNEIRRQKTDYVSEISNAATKEETIRVTVEEFPADEDFKTRFFEAQDRLGELEQELRNTRERLRNLENACENTEEKIGVLKNAAYSYHRTFSEHEVTIKTVVEENKYLKISIDKLEATIRGYKEEQEKAHEIKKDNDNLKDQLDEMTKENDDLVRQLEKLQMELDDLRDNNGDDKACKYGGRGDDILQEMESFKLKYEEIETENGNLQKEKEELRVEVDDLERRLKDLQIRLSADDEIIEEMKQQIVEYHEQIQQSEENCDNSRTRNIELEKEMSILRGLVAELESSLEAEKDSRESLFREGTNRLEIQNKKITQLEMNLKEVCKEKELLYLQFVDSKNKAEMDSKQCTKQLNETHVRAELFRREVSDKEKTISALKAENEELRDDIALLQKQLEDLQDRDLSRFAEDLDKPDGNDDDELSKLRQENKEITEELEQLRDEVISLQSELAERYIVEEKPKDEDSDEIVVEHLQVVQRVPLASIEDDLSDFDDFEEHHDIVAVGETPNLAAVPKESGDSWSSQDYSKLQIQELEELLERTKKEKEKVEECLEESEERAKKTTEELSKTIAQLTDRCEEMRMELTEKEAMINEQRKDLSQDKNTISDLEEKLQEQEYLEAELEKARKELLELKSQETNKDLSEEYEKLKEQYEKLMEDRKKLKDEKEDLCEKKADVEEELEEMKVKFDKGKEMYNTLCDENDDLKKDNDDLAKQVDKLKEEIKYLGDELKEEEDLHITEKEKLTSKNKELEDKIRRLEGEISDLKAKLRRKDDDENWKEKFDELKREKNSLQIEKQRLERNLERNDDEHEQTKTKYNKVRRELNDAQGETAMLRRQLSELKLTKDTGDLEKELRKLKETLRKKEEESKNHLAELGELKRSLFRQTSEEGWQEKFESLKLKLDEVEDEKDSLQKEKNNLQNDLRKDSEKLAELEIKLSQANREIDGLSKDFDKSHTRITQLEIELQRSSKQRQHAEEQAKWIKKELLTREETISKLGKELNEKMEDNDKDNQIIMLEREIQLLQSRIPASEKDESVLHNRIRFLEDSVKEVKEKLDGKTVQLDKCEKEKESLSVHVVELSKEIQVLYERYQASRTEIEKLRAGLALTPEKTSETTSLTIDVEGKPEVQLGVFVQERVRSRVVTPGLGRSTSELEISISQFPGTVVIGEPVGVTVDYGSEGNPLVSHPVELTASEPEDNDEDSFSHESDDEDVPPVVYSAPQVESAPQFNFITPSVDPERILVSAQALPRPQLPKSVDSERFPFLKASGVRLSGGAFQPVLSRNINLPDQTTEEDLSDKELVPEGRFRAFSKEDQFKLDGLLHAHAHHHDPPDGYSDVYDQPPENGVENNKGYYSEEPNGREKGWTEPPPYDWNEPPLQAPREAYSYRSAPGGEYLDDFHSQLEQYSDPYQMPPQKPESSYKRRIIGVYDNDGTLIGYQDVYEELTDEYAEEINGGVIPYPEPYEYRGLPHPHEPEQRPLMKIPHTTDTRGPEEDESVSYEYDSNRNATKDQRFSPQPEERFQDNRKHTKESNKSHRQGYPEQYEYLNGDGARRNRPAMASSQYSSGTYL